MPIINRFAIIIGAMKSGTTALFTLLEQHPEICGCNEKEPGFFVWKNYSTKSLRSYYSLWNYKRKKYKYALEASTSYTKLPTHRFIPKLIQKSGIDARFIYIMRNPVQRIESHLRMASATGYKLFTTNGEFIPEKYSLYHFQISEYSRYFPVEYILLLRFEDFIEKPEKVLKKICLFLNIDPSFNFDVNSIERNDSSDYLEPKEKTPIFWMTLHHFKEFLKYFFLFKKRKWKKQRFEVPNEILTLNTVLSIEQKEKMMENIQEDMRLLKKDYGFDTSRWTL